MQIVSHAYGFLMNICGEICIAGSTHEHVGDMRGTKCRGWQVWPPPFKNYTISVANSSFRGGHGQKLVPRRHSGEATDMKTFRSLLSPLKQFGPHIRSVTEHPKPTASWSDSGDTLQVRFWMMRLGADCALSARLCLTTALMAVAPVYTELKGDIQNLLDTITRCAKRLTESC
jgi:hypothetical protein